jgi:AraC-like DNA-binding protein
MLRVIADAMQRRDIPPAAYMGSAAADLYADSAERMLPVAELQHVLAQAVRVAREPALGLQCGLSASESSFGLIAPLIAHASNLRHGLALVAQFHPLLSDAGSFELLERAGTARLCCQLEATPLARDHSFVELVLAGFQRLLHAFGCTRADIRAVCFEYARPGHHAAYTLAFGGAERFGQSFTGIELRVEALDRPHLHNDVELHRLVLERAERCLLLRTRPTCCAERVRVLLRRAAPTQLPDMDEVARKLGMSVRSLRRRLETEGTSYRELSQELVHAYACTMLRNPEITLQGVAHALGFADAASFHRAFRRASGCTPAAYRAAALGEVQGLQDGLQ